MFEPSPNTVAFESATASSRSRTRNSAATGPKTSSPNIGASGFGRERTNVGARNHRIADLQRAHPRDKALCKRIEHIVMHDEPLGGNATLAVVLAARNHRDARRLVEI